MTSNLIFDKCQNRPPCRRSYGVMAITLDFESNNPSSNLGRTLDFYVEIYDFHSFSVQTVRTVKSNLNFI